jgi:tyrosyl-tRNA synthetase
VTRIFHGEEAAAEAKEQFVELVQNKGTAENIPKVCFTDPKQTLMTVLQECLGKEVSNSEIRRLLEQGSIKIDGEKKANKDEELTLTTEGFVLKVGKKKWFKVMKA